MTYVFREPTNRSHFISWICTCIYIPWICICLCVFACVFACGVYLCVCMCLCACVRACVYECAFAWEFVCVCTGHKYIHIFLLFTNVCEYSAVSIQVSMGWLRLVGSLKLQVSFAKESYKRDDILQMRPIILRNLLIISTPYEHLAMSIDFYEFSTMSIEYSTILVQMSVNIQECQQCHSNVCEYIFNNVH